MKTTSDSSALIKGVLVGAGCAGVVSLIPLVNLLNLFFMFWMAVGGAIAVWVFQRRHRRATPGEAALAGGLSGLLGGMIFSLVTYVTMQFITPDSFERVVQLLRKLLPALEQEAGELLGQGDFRTLLGMVLLMSIGISALVGILGGLAARWSWSPPKDSDPTGDGQPHE